MESPGIETAAVMLLLALAAFVRQLVSRTRERRQRHALPRAARIQSTTMYETLQQIAESLGAQRAMLMKAHNGEGVPSVGSSLKITHVQGWRAFGLANLSGEYVARPLSDRHYRMMIAELDRKEIMLLETSDLAQGSLLRDELEREELRSAWVTFVRRTPSEFFFMVVASRTRLDPDGGARARLRGAAARLNHLLTTDLTYSHD